MYFAYKYIQKKRKARLQEATGEANHLPGPAAPASAGTSSPDAGSGSRPAESQPGERDVEAESKKSKKSKSSQKKELTPEEKAAKRKRRIYRWKILLGLMMPFTLQGLDTTIVASALPFIAADFTFLPFWSQMADIFGRHITLHATLVVMLVGSAICTGAPTRAFGVLLLGRALQGVGASGINICVRTILADRVSLKEYALNWTIFALVSTFSFSIGPVVGGYLTEANWRWCFAINLPVAVVAIGVVVILLRNDLLGPQPLPELEGRHDVSTRYGRFIARMSTVDVGGQLLFLWGLGLVILALTWGGGEYGWKTAHVLAPLVIGVVLSIAWVGYEYLMSPGRAAFRLFSRQRAMIPWDLLSQRNIGLLFIVNFSVGVAMFANLYFMNIFFAVVRGYSSSKSGIALLYFLPGLGVGSYMAMFASNVWPKQTIPPLLLGSITSAVGITVLTYAVHANKVSLVYGMMALTGHGVGIRMNPGSLHGLAYFPQHTASISCLISFALPFGGMVSLTLMSTVYNNKGGSSSIPSDAQNGIMWAFIAVIPFMWIGVLITAFLGNVWIITSERHEVVNGAYLWSLVTRKKLVRESRTRGEHKFYQDDPMPLQDEESAAARATS